MNAYATLHSRHDESVWVYVSMAESAVPQQVEFEQAAKCEVWKAEE